MTRFAVTLSILLLSFSVFGGERPRPITVYPGYLTKILCRGRLFISGVGNESIIERQAFPKDLGCGVLVRPKALSGQTNLILETSTGSIHRILEISSNARPSSSADLEISLQEDAK